MSNHKHIKDCKSKFALNQRESMSIDACEGVLTSELQHGVLKSYKQALEKFVGIKGSADKIECLATISWVAKTAKEALNKESE